MSANGLYLQIPHQSTSVQPAVEEWEESILDKSNTDKLKHSQLQSERGAKNIYLKRLVK
jgi:hypothetical protein